MFVRKKQNKSGSVSIQVIDKTDGYRVVQTVGSAWKAVEVERLWQKALSIVHGAKEGQQQLFSTQTQTDVAVENFVEELSNASVRTIGPELIFGTLFDRLGFNAVEEELFRHIVIARLAYPTSKLKTVDYLYRYKGISIGVQTVYRFLDALNDDYKEQVECIAFEHTKRTLGSISVVFYDMTTLYFEAEDEDDLRKIGFSKDGKFQKPQIMLGLLVGERGLPIGYDIFEGNTFEGHTLLPTLEKIQKKYGFGKPVVIADAGLLSTKNISALKEEGYRFIIGGRIKNESEEIQKIMLKQAEGMKDGDSLTIKKKDGTRLVVTYSDKRARKDTYNREKGLRKLRKRVKTGKLTKESINNRGYNKFLSLEGETVVSIDEEKVGQDKHWDGLKGYVTNSRYSAKRITENYTQLWQIEKAFRISKTDLKVRPIHHYKRKRIEAHICIAFVAYAIYKELEIQLQKHKVAMSPKRAAELTDNMYELEYTLPDSKELKRKMLHMDEEQSALYHIIHR
jgi:transposase